jgi:hypothetical protein
VIVRLKNFIKIVLNVNFPVVLRLTWTGLAPISSCSRQKTSRTKAGRQTLKNIQLSPNLFAIIIVPFSYTSKLSIQIAIASVSPLGLIC